ncbi:hypothetical protein COBT_001204, partial [Conglomerata obtusa]
MKPRNTYVIICLLNLSLLLNPDEIEIISKANEIINEKFNKKIELSKKFDDCDKIKTAKLLCKVNKRLIKCIQQTNHEPIFVNPDADISFIIKKFGTITANKLYVEFVSLHHVMLMNMLVYDCQNKSLKIMEYILRVLEELKRFCDGTKDILDYLACLCNGLSDMQNKYATKNVKKSVLLSYITSSINSFDDK